MNRSMWMAAVLCTGISAQAAGQACLGLPTAPRQLAIEARVNSGENDTGYGGRAVAHLPWSFAVGASYRLDDYELIEETGHTFGGVVAVELPFPGNSICIVSEPTFSTFDFPEGLGLAPATVETLRLPLLAGAGTRLDIGSLFVVPSALGGLLYQRTTADKGAAGIAEESSTEVMIEAGAAVGSGNAFANAAIHVVSGQDTRPRFLIGVGVMLP